MEEEDLSEEEHDFSSLNKYFKDDDSINAPDKIVKTIVEDVSVSAFDSYDKDENQEIDYAEEESNNPKEISLEKKEFLKSLEEDGLNLDACVNLNRDWNRR